MKLLFFSAKFPYFRFAARGAAAPWSIRCRAYGAAFSDCGGGGEFCTVKNETGLRERSATAAALWAADAAAHAGSVMAARSHGKACSRRAHVRRLGHSTLGFVRTSITDSRTHTRAPPRTRPAVWPGRGDEPSSRTKRPRSDLFFFLSILQRSNLRGANDLGKWRVPVFRQLVTATRIAYWAMCRPVPVYM